MINLIAYFPLVLTILLSGCEKDEVNFYVSVNGKDSNNGTLQEPFRTLSKAVYKVKVIRGNNENRKINIFIREGTYRLDSTLKLENFHNSVHDAGILITSYKEENVRIIGGKIIDNSHFQKIKPEEMPDALPDPDSGYHIYKYDLNKLNIEDLGEIKQFGFSTSIKPAQVELFYNNKPLILARYPNKGRMAIGEILEKGPVPFENDFRQKGGTFHYYGNRPSKWSESNNIWIYGTFSGGYTDNNVHVKQIDTIKKTITTSHPDMFGFQATDSSSEWSGGVRSFYAYNIMEELDFPGEFFMDKKNNILYVIPPDKEFNKEIAVSVLETPLVTLEGISNVTIRDINFEYGRGIGVSIVDGQNNHISNCNISNFGTVGVMFGKGVVSPDYPIHEFTGELKTGIVGNIKAHVYQNNDFYNYAGQNNSLENCKLSKLGSGGVILSGGNRKSLTPGNNIVKNCEIYNFSRRNKTYCPGVALYGVKNKIMNCHIYDGPQQAIAIQGNDHLISQNVIEKMTLDSHDNGAIYIGRNPTEMGTVISHNLFFKIGKPGNKNCSVHLDDCASGIKVFGNIFFQGSRSDFGDILLNGGNYNRLDNNVFINGAHALWIENPYRNVKHEYDERMETGGLWHKRLYEEIDIFSPSWKSKYPSLSMYKHPVDQLPFLKKNTFNSNLIVNTPLVVSKHNLDTAVFYQSSNNYSCKRNIPVIHSPEDILKGWINEYGSKYIVDFENIPIQNIGLEDSSL